MSKVGYLVSSPLGGEGDREAVEGSSIRAGLSSSDPSTTLRAVPLPIGDGEETRL